MFKPKLAWLLVFVPVAVVLELTHADPVIIFAVSALAILPLAGQIGHATEDMAARSGPQIGGLLNATFGNVTEFLIAVYALSLLFSFKTHKALFRGATHTEEPKWSLRRAIGVWPGQPCWWP